MGKTEISIIRPAEIESESFRIIEEELRQKGRKIPEDYKHVLLRVIHTTADFEYLDTMAFSEDVLMAAEDALRRGAHIVTDTTMAMAGINKRRLAQFGGEAHCFIADTDVAEAAQEAGTTRSAAAVHKADLRCGKRPDGASCFGRRDRQGIQAGTRHRSPRRVCQCR